MNVLISKVGIPATVGNTTGIAFYPFFRASGKTLATSLRRFILGHVLLW